ncbi:MAG: glycosyl hydrolase [Actinomycetota bacterium]|nr:glycosyl hydrolase [Actinomycetota bacterium]
MYVRRLGLLLAVAAALSAAMPAGAAAQRAVPPLFYGMNWDGEIEANGSEMLRDAEHGRMATHGVETLRISFEWMRAQRRAGGPFSFARTDRVVRHAAMHGIDLLPVVILAPRWAREYPQVTHSPPKRTGDYTRYLRALIARYGPAGSFWTENPLVPKSPIRAWQIWNEPHLQFQWSIPTGVDYAPGYGKLLRASHRTIKFADRDASVVLGGISNFSWQYLDHMYKRGKIKGAFDVAALHPYTTKPEGVITLTKRFRIVMRRYKDGKLPIWITELGLPASQGRIRSNNKLQTTDTGMAQFLFRSYKHVVKNQASSLAGAQRVYWYNWASVYCCEQFRFTGLLQYDNKETTTPKPALEQYRRSARRDQGCEKDERAQCAQPAPASPAPR